MSDNLALASSVENGQEPGGVRALNTCGVCGLEITPPESGVRHFGFYVAHSEYRCVELLRLKITALEAAIRRTMEATGIVLNHPSGDLADEFSNVMQAFLIQTNAGRAPDTMRMDWLEKDRDRLHNFPYGSTVRTCIDMAMREAACDAIDAARSANAEKSQPVSTAQRSTNE